MPAFVDSGGKLDAETIQERFQPKTLSLEVVNVLPPTSVTNSGTS